MTILTDAPIALRGVAEADLYAELRRRLGVDHDGDWQALQGLLETVRDNSQRGTTPQPVAETATVGEHHPKKRLAPIACAPWCRNGSGHRDALFVEDQSCLSDVPGDEIVDLDGAELVQVSAYSRPGEPAKIVLWTQGEVGLTPEQAADFSRAYNETLLLIQSSDAAESGSST